MEYPFTVSMCLMPNLLLLLLVVLIPISRATKPVLKPIPQYLLVRTHNGITDWMREPSQAASGRGRNQAACTKRSNNC